MYQVKRLSRSEYVPIRNLTYHVLVWGEPGPGKVPLVMVHGWMDVAASYQFVVDAFAQDHYVIAPDWRGYGLTGVDGPPLEADGPLGGQRSVGAKYWPDADNYWYPDYLADLDFLLDHYSPEAPVHLVGPQHGRQRRHAVCRCAAPARSPAGQPRRLRHARHAAGPGAQALRALDGRTQGAAPRRKGTQAL